MTLLGISSIPDEILGGRTLNISSSSATVIVLKFPRVGLLTPVVFS